jgi:hypothetical protein
MGKRKYSLLGYERQLDNHIINDKGEPVVEVWHGGHPNIDKFDMSKMGTGEGAQAYSPGLYNAERKGVAGDYRDSITKRLQANLAHKYGIVTLGDLVIPVSARNWIRIEDTENALSQDVYDSLTSLVKFERDIHSEKARYLDWRLGEKNIREARDWDGYEENYGELTYEQEMEFQHGKDWKNVIGYVSVEPESDFNIKQGGFFLEQGNGDDIYVRVEGNKTIYDDPVLGEEIITEYPLGTSHDFMEFDHQARTWAESTEASLHDPEPWKEDVSNSYQLAYEFASDGTRLHPMGATTQFVFAGPSQIAPNDPFGSTPVSSRRMTREGVIFEERSPEYYEHMQEANQELSRISSEHMDEIYSEIFNGKLPVWDQQYMPLPDSSNMKGGLYKNHLHVNPDELLDWFEPIGLQPKKLQDKIRKYFDSKDQDFFRPKYVPSDVDLTYDMPLKAGWGHLPPTKTKEELWEEQLKMTGQEFFQNSSGGSGGRNQFRDDMDAVGMPGVIYQDYTRNSGRGDPTYNIVMYSDEPIEIIERGAATAPMLASVFGITSAALASAVAGKKAGFFDTVLDQDIAERFPMPEEPDNRTGLDKVLEHEGFLTPYLAEALQSDTAKQIYAHPVSQYIGKQFENAEFFPRSLMSGVEGAYNAVTGMPASENLGGMWDRLNTPIADTADDVGRATLKATGSPLAAAGTSLGVILMEP